MWLSTNEKSVKSQGHSQQITLVDFLAEVSTIEPTKNNTHNFEYRSKQQNRISNEVAIQKLSQPTSYILATN